MTNIPEEQRIEQNEPEYDPTDELMAFYEDLERTHESQLEEIAGTRESEVL